MTSTRQSTRVASWPQGLTLALQSIFPTMGVMLLVPVLPLLMRQFGDVAGARYLVPSLLTIPALCIALFSVLAGYVGDRLGHRRVLIAGLSFYALAGMAPFVLSSFATVLASRVFLGLCEAIIITLSATLIGDYFRGHERDRWLGLSATAASVSAIVFAAVGGLLGDALGWRGPVLVYGTALLFIPAMLFLTWDPERHEAAAGEETDKANFPWRHIAIVAPTALVGSTFFFSLTVHQGLALSALGLERARDIGFLAALTSFAVPIGTLLFIRVSNLRTATLLATEFVLFAGSFLMISQAQGYLWFSIAAFVGLLAAGMLLPTLLTWAIRGLPYAVRGRGTGVFQSMFALGQFASGLIIPALAYNVTDGILPAFGALGLAAAVLAAIAVVANFRSAPRSARS